MPEHGNHSHVYVVPEEHISLAPGEYHQFQFTVIVTEDIELESRFAHWESPEGIFDVWAEIAGISGISQPLPAEITRSAGRSAGLSRPLPKLFADLAEEVLPWTPVFDIDSDHYRDNTFEPETYLDNVIWEDNRNLGGDKDNHDGDNARLVEVRIPEPTVSPSPNQAVNPTLSPTPAPTISASAAVEPSQSAARRNQLYRTGIQTLAIVIGACLVVIGVAQLRKRANEA